ncbi:N-acetylglucosamine kinase-like BadF-type ATPase [Pseudoduganella flava]|uniref:ATPase n=1 Tax=Pseudoduganella flava TaxID=871742 RepID=A0A562PG89_9BURK|nr:BadF/BadG/BcrA/BcrD ATPase family protein [Pseudoduganella flava]QGZ40290.1 ATPase [Pseudoduganella flava]TWI43475.1 N-acetylglucosamine kinase-like BadF-type ATPase [Pseudoduganella flava]
MAARDTGLGIDAGGTQTRWALADAAGAIVAEGHVAGASALQMASPAGRERLRATFEELARAVLAHGAPVRVRAGLTGFGGDGHVLIGWLADLLGVAPAAIALCNDIEIAYLDAFAPGQGYLVYAGTGSIAAYIDEAGTFHRAGGRGVMLDDAGGGFWIAREAMRRIWRREDEEPGAWQRSPLAHAVFDHVGGSDWSYSRQFIYTRERGEIGQLALAVARSAEHDAEAHDILRQAGRELARLARALVARFGPRPIVLAGRAAGLHPLIAQAVRDDLPAALAFEQRTARPHAAAARLAARGD